MKIDHEIVLLSFSLLLNQEGQLSVFGDRISQILVNCIEDKAWPGKVWLGKLTGLTWP